MYNVFQKLKEWKTFANIENAFVLESRVAKIYLVAKYGTTYGTIFHHMG